MSVDESVVIHAHVCDEVLGHAHGGHGCVVVEHGCVHGCDQTELQSSDDQDYY